jgi:hypothetical protein
MNWGTALSRREGENLIYRQYLTTIIKYVHVQCNCILRRSSVSSVGGIALSDNGRSSAAGSDSGASSTNRRRRRSHTPSTDTESGDEGKENSGYDRAAALTELYKDLGTPQHVIKKVYGKSHTVDVVEVDNASPDAEDSTDHINRGRKRVISQSQSMQVTTSSGGAGKSLPPLPSDEGGSKLDHIEKSKKKKKGRQMHGTIYGAAEPQSSHPTAFQY